MRIAACVAGVAVVAAAVVVALRTRTARRLRREVEAHVLEVLEETFDENFGATRGQAEAAGVALVSDWLDELGHDPNRAEIRRFAADVSQRPPANVRHTGRVTKRA